MNTKTKTILTWSIVILAVLIAGVVVFKNSDLYQSFTDNQRSNWQWDNQWPKEEADEPLTPPSEDQGEEHHEPIHPKPIQGQVKANSFEQAKSLASQYNRPILVIFGASWCQWCKKMDTETLTNANVKKMMEHYVLLHINTDKDRSVATKFGVRSLPAYVITNAGEQKLKSAYGYMKAPEFTRWINNPKMFQQSNNKQKPEKKQHPNLRNRKTPPQKEAAPPPEENEDEEATYKEESTPYFSPLK